MRFLYSPAVAQWDAKTWAAHMDSITDGTLINHKIWADGIYLLAQSRNVL